jgi:hypothetical protein
MNIESVKITIGGYNITSEGNKFFIPNDAENLDYQAILTWLAQGNSVEPEFTDQQLLVRAKEIKKNEIKELRTTLLAVNILAKNIDGKSYYVKTDPEINLFSSAILMEEGSTRIWGCFCEGEKILIELTKAELLSIANHYEVRKSQEYNLCDLRRAEVSLLTNIEDVEAFDINKVYE